LQKLTFAFWLKKCFLPLFCRKYLFKERTKLQYVYTFFKSVKAGQVIRNSAWLYCRCT
jgi:hypothetical protein